MCLRVPDVQVVENEMAAVFQRPCDVFHDTQVVLWFIEVTEAREQADHIVVRVRSKGTAHVLTDPAHRPSGTHPGECHAFGRQVDSGHMKAASSEVDRVPTIPATEIED